MTPVIPSPVSIMRGKSRIGSLHSSAMLTESSKPTIAKKASEVAAVIAKNVLLSLGLSKTTTREKSALPWVTAYEPDEDDHQQAGQLDEGEHDVGLDALADPAEVDRRHDGHERPARSA